MRIKITIKTKKLPIIYRHRFISLIKEGLKKDSPEYKDSLYLKKQPKQFTFSLLLPDSKEVREEEIQIDKKFIVKDKVFYFNEDISLFVSSLNHEFMINLYNGLLKLKKFDFSFDENMLVNSEFVEMEIKKIILLQEKKIIDNKIIFKTNSPVIIEDENDKPVHYESDRIRFYLNENTNKIFKTLFGRGLKSELIFTPLKLEKQVIKHTLKEFREKTGKPIMYLTGFKGIFELQGDPEDLDIFYKSGLGNKTSQGFGMLEVVG